MKSSSLLIVFAVLVAGGLVAFAAMKNSSSGPSPYDAFAQCLTDNGVTMYGAWWCPHCKSQKELFGSSFDNVNYVECSDANKNMSQLCKDAGVTGYPAWKFADGTMLSGEQSLEILGFKAECDASAAAPVEVPDINASSSTNAATP